MCEHFILAGIFAVLYFLSELIGTLPAIRRNAFYLLLFDFISGLLGWIKRRIF